MLFGLIMVLTVTGSLSIAQAGQAEVRTMLIGALGCNLAWGIIDGVFYLMTSLSERGRGTVMLRALRKAKGAAEAYRIVSDALPPVVTSVLSPADFEAMRERLTQLPDPPTRLRPSKADWLRALGVFLLVFLSTFPVVIPFLLVRDARLALHLSNAVAILMLFLAGYAFGRYVGRPPWRAGFWMIILGSVLAGITKALGG